ncbi:hypothetical protein ILUMI_10553 [Ignelater luminosus]|uniref:Uncharacterized protein n=1 Tax=Ignelater luminosus TaxID=2038154 RepID=A0A8K0D330_IGNLU|nr:hypothetical protein ILUMI_10553 [Ignelater luminosus]
MYRQKQKENENSNNTWYYISSRYSPKRDNNNGVLIEWRLAVIGLIFSLSVLTAKILHANRYELYSLIFEKQLVSYETITSDGEVMLKYAWTTVVKYSRFWFPVLCGALATWFTWLMVYLDSEVPGVQPPSPLSPSKYKIRSGHTFHLNYVFAVVVGVFIFFYMYMREVTLQL